MIKLLSILALLALLTLQCGGFSRPQVAKTTQQAFMQMVGNGEVKSYEIVDNLDKVNVYLVPAAREKHGVEGPDAYDVTERPLPRRYITRREPDMTFSFAGDFERQMEAYYRANGIVPDKHISYNVIAEKNWW